MDQTTLLFFGKSGGSSPAVLDTLNVTANGTYTPPSGTDGYNEVNVNVTPALETLSATSNGSYSPSAGKDGFSSVTVAVVPELETKSITTNGTYTPSTGKDGFSSVMVNVPSSQVPFVPSSGTCKCLFGINAYATASDAQRYALNNLQNKTFTNPDSCEYMFYGFDGDAGDVTLISDSVAGNAMFAKSNLTGVPNISDCYFNNLSSFCSYSKGLIPLNVKIDNNYYIDLSNFLSDSGTLVTVAPTFYFKNGNTLKMKSSGAVNMFENCKYVRNFDNVFPENVEFDFSNQTYVGIYGIFMFAHSMLNIPSWYNKLIHAAINTASSVSTNFYSWYYGDFRECRCCVNFTNIPIIPIAFTSNCFSNGAFYGLMSCEHFTFETNNGNPYVVNWKNQVINLNDSMGWDQRWYEGPYYYCPDLFTANREINDDSDYARLKNDNYRWTKKVRYSRYNRSSAVETINSLPDCSGSGGTNTINFKGEAGTNTDGGAISNLTSAEIAVAAAKGWTVTIQ